MKLSGRVVVDARTRIAGAIRLCGTDYSWTAPLHDPDPGIADDGNLGGGERIAVLGPIGEFIF